MPAQSTQTADYFMKINEGITDDDEYKNKNVKQLNSLKTKCSCFHLNMKQRWACHLKQKLTFENRQQTVRLCNVNLMHVSSRSSQPRES